ncbi:PIN domain-containing protein [Neobacillus sp. NPDC093127]|uniref:PIN domain-containing protein n=1 Tax=Neobacillus sp. NPDC093127 TaxID=3364296 RepID=UPI00382E8FE3
MSKLFVDTNVMIRLIIKDDFSKLETLTKLIKKVENGEFTLVIPTIVIAECCWLLKSYYHLDKQQISEYIIAILESDHVEAEENIVTEALRIFSEKNVDFADALLSVKVRNSFPLLTWDQKDFKKLNCEYFKPEDIVES